MVKHTNNPSGYKQYQDWFTERRVGASKHGVPSIVDEIEGLREDINNVPWSTLTPEERVSIAVVANAATAMVVKVAHNQGDIEDTDMVSIMSKVDMSLFNAVTETEDPFDGGGMDLLLMRLENGTIDEW